MKRFQVSCALLLSLASINSFSQTSPLRFEKQPIAFESNESVGTFDVDKDGHIDLVSGSYWYKGPEFRERFLIGQVKRYGEYYEDFSTIPMDVNGDGKMDYVTGGWFEGKLVWKENPGNNGEWKEHFIAETGNIETARAWDIDGDGTLEIVPNTPRKPLAFYKWIGPSQFEKYEVFETQGHGLGFGDINGDGFGDLVSSFGWYEAPADLSQGTWTFHPTFDLGDISVPVIVTDLNEDGMNDLIVGNGHNYGLFWMEQKRSADGKISFVQHDIDPYQSQYHTLEWVDLDGDGKKELVTGKRYRAHNGKDPGGLDEIGLYYFKWDGKNFVKNVISHGPFGVGKGTGIYFSVTDLNGDGKPDIAVAGKDGLAVFWQK